MSGAPNRKKWWILGGAAVLFGLILIVPEVAHAGIWPDWLSPVGIVTAPFRVLGYLINYIIGIFLWLATQVTNVMFEMNEEILSESNAIVGVGWNLTRDVANLGFVLLLILVALATIVRYREYEASRLLPKLIAAAILVNFSLAIAGIFIDFSNVLTRTFVNRTQGGGTFALIDDIMSAFGPQRLMLSNSENPLPPDPSEEQGALLSFGAGVLSSLAGIVFSIIFTAIATLAMAALAIMLFLRYLHLTFLVLIAPLTWLFWVFPGLSKYHGEWWSAFIKWVFFAPAVSFFMYLATLSVRTIQHFQLNPSQGQGIGGALMGLMSQGVQMFVLAGIMLGGIIVGQKMGIGGAGAIRKVAEGAKAGALKWSKNVTQRAGIAAARGAKSAASGVAEWKYGKRVLQSEQFKAVAGGATATKERLKKMGKGFEVKPEDTLLTKLSKRVSNVATGATGLRALSGFTGGAMEMPGKIGKGITTTAGRYVKSESLMESVLSGAKEGFFGKAEKGEKTTDDHVKALKDTIKNKKKLKDRGVLTAETEKEWDKKIAREQQNVRSSLTRPGTTEGWKDQIKMLREYEGDFIKDLETGDEGIKAFDDLIKEAQNNMERELEREERKTLATKEAEGALTFLKDQKVRAIQGGNPEVTVNGVTEKLSAVFDRQIEATEKLIQSLGGIDKAIAEKDKPWESQRIMRGLDETRAGFASLNQNLAAVNTAIAAANQLQGFAGAASLTPAPNLDTEMVDVVEATIRNEKINYEKIRQGTQQNQGDAQQGGGQQTPPRNTIYTAYNTPYTPPPNP